MEYNPNGYAGMNDIVAKVKIFFNKICIVLYSCLCIFRKKAMSKEERKQILIIANGALGDGVLLLGAIRKLDKMFNIETGYELTLVCDTRCENLFINNISNRVQKIVVKTLNQRPELHDFIKIVKKLQEKYFEKCIVFIAAGWGDYLALCTYANIKISALCRTEGKNPVSKYVINKLYDIKIEWKDEFLASACEKVIHILGDPQYRAQKELLIPKCYPQKTDEKEYIVVAPMAAFSYRSLSKKQIAELVKYLLDNTILNIILTGIERHNQYLQEIITECGSDRVVNYAGRTRTDEFIALVCGARVLIGADSGQIHIAAAFNIPCICLAGYWNKGCFLPYDFLEGNDNPVCIYCQEVSCAGCIIKHGAGKPGSGNDECYKRIRKGENAMCLEKVDMSDVYAAIRKLKLRGIL